MHRLPVRSRLKGIDLLVVTLLFYGNEPAFIGVFGTWIPLPRILSVLRNLRFHAWMLRTALFGKAQSFNLLRSPYELIVMLFTLSYLCWYLSPVFMRKVGLFCNESMCGSQVSSSILLSRGIIFVKDDFGLSCYAICLSVPFFNYFVLSIVIMYWFLC